MFQRLGDARIFNGWIKEITPVKVVAHLRTTAAIELEDEFSFQVYGSKMNASFLAKVTATRSAEDGAVFATDDLHSPNALEVVCRVTTSMRYATSVEDPRFCVKGAKADISVGPGRLLRSVTILDLGPRGFAALTDQPLAKGEVATVALYAYGLLVKVEATVRSSVKVAPDTEMKRIGFEVTNLDRATAARWKQVYAAVVASNRIDWQIEDAGVQERLSA